MRFCSRDIQKRQVNTAELHQLVRILLKTAIREKIKIRILHENAHDPAKFNLIKRLLNSVNLNSTDLFKKSLLIQSYIYSKLLAAKVNEANHLVNESTILSFHIIEA